MLGGLIFGAGDEIDGESCRMGAAGFCVCAEC